MKMRTQVKAGDVSINHNDMLRVRSAINRRAEPQSQRGSARSVGRQGRESWRQTTTGRCGSGRRSRLEGQSLNHNEALRVRSAVKAGKLATNHNGMLRVRSAVKAGGQNLNHNEALRVRSAVKAGGHNLNHNEALRDPIGAEGGGVNLNHSESLRVRTTLEAGGQSLNHNEILRS